MTRNMCAYENQKSICKYHLTEYHFSFSFCISILVFSCGRTGIGVRLMEQKENVREGERDRQLENELKADFLRELLYTAKPISDISSRSRATSGGAAELTQDCNANTPTTMIQQRNAEK